jgi:phenylacetate-CoA ligase
MRKHVEQRIFNPIVERMSRSELEALRWRRLRSTLERTYAASPFYRKRMQRAGVTPDDIRTPEDFRNRVPMVDKLDVLADQREHPPLGSAIAVPDALLEYCFLTSGTSGKGQEVHAYTGADVTESLTSWASSLHWAGVMPGDVAYHMVPIGVTAGPVTLLASFQRYGLRTFAVGNMEGEARLEMMRRFPPNFFSTGPVYLRRLTTICREMGIDPRRDFPALKAIKLGSFGFDVPWAREMEAFWGAKLIDTYASTQCGGGIASTCEHGTYLADGRRGMMHFPEHKVWAEVLNPQTGEPAREDEEGEVILTAFGREAMPILRFRTGDKVVFKSHRQCACGRPFDGIEAGTVSRYDTMLKIRGMNLWPEAVDAIVLAHPEIDEYNGRLSVADNGREVARVLVEFKATASSSAAHRAHVLEQLRSQIKECTGVGMEVCEAASGEVERFAYKEKRWKDQRREQL